MIAASLAGCGGPQISATATQLAAAGPPQPLAAPATAPAALAPGLAVRYFDGYYRHIDELPASHAAMELGRPGPPILSLNHQFGFLPVFDSGRGHGVGMLLTGYLLLENTGTYLFSALSNDGVRIFLGDVQVADDPAVHRDKFSDPVSVSVAEPGWYPLKIQYFQRKGSAALKLYWRPPTATDFVIVPAAAYGHLEAGSIQ